MWIASPPLDVEEAKEAPRKVVLNVDEHVRNGQIGILPHTIGISLAGNLIQT